MDKTRPLFPTLLKTVFLASSLLISAQAHSQDAVAPTGNASAEALKWSGDGLKIELQALTPDLTRAFFIGRGFPKKAVELLANEACVFRSAIGHSSQNSADPSVTIELKKWRVIKGAKAYGLRTREMWREIWKSRKLDQSARTAFHWALIPTEQTYSVTDYNWGMLTFMEKPSVKFDLEIAWRVGNEPKTHIFKALQCGRNQSE